MIDQFELQRAVVARLTSQISDVPTYENVPQNAPYPYIRIDSMDANEAGTKDTNVYEYEIVLSVFDRNLEENAPVVTIMKRIHAALHNQAAAMPMTGYGIVLIRHDWQTLRQSGDPDDEYYHGIQRYRVRVQEI